MTEFELEEVFIYRKRVCAIVKGDLGVSSHFSKWRNGYVSVTTKNNGKGYTDMVFKIKTVELTYSGDLKEHGLVGWFVGFDTNHYYNETHPETKTHEAVRKQIIELANELIRKRI